MSELKKPESFSREHRLGLVVYGGVALAVYMNGICQEFYNAVRGRGIYKLVKAFTDADIVVDIISGTSAGGINGVLLSFVLANSNEQRCLEFKDFAEVWKRSGDIQKLLFDKKYDGIEKTSFFDGKGYYKSEIKQALELVWKNSVEQACQDDWFSEFGELDLFVTGTDVLGRIYKTFDNTGNAIEVKDHKTVFQLKYRDFGHNPFEPNGESEEIVCEALAKLCQITSCFPIAFPPVTVRLDTESNSKDSEEESREKKIDAKLNEWGSLRKNRLLLQTELGDGTQPTNKKIKEIEDDPGKGARLHFVDGGVLDNRPFSYTIKEIYHRTAERPVFRKLFYIDPSPDCLTNNPNYREMKKPSIFRVVTESLVGMPRYESINNDLEMIKDHNEKVRRYNFLQADVEEVLDTYPVLDQVENKSANQVNRDVADQQRYICLRARLINIKDKILPLIYLESEIHSGSNQEQDKAEIINTIAQLLTNSLSNPKEYSQRLKLLEKLEKDVLEFDVEYALRKQFFITNYVFKLLDRNYLCGWIKKKRDMSTTTYIEDEDVDRLIDYLKGLIKHFNYHVKILEIVQEELYKFFSCNEIRKYFVVLLQKSQEQGDEHLAKQFPEDFYKSMLQLYKKLLNVNLPTDFLEIPSNFTREQMKSKLNLLKEKFKETASSLRAELSQEVDIQSRDESGSTDCILERLSRKTTGLLEHPTQEITYLDSLVGTKNTSSQKLREGKLLTYFKEFERIDAYLFPLDYLAGVPEKQIIETYRISPEDAKLGFSASIKDGERLNRKLAGDSLNAFGGFLKESWRTNDILWGRLDGLNRIIESLVTVESVQSFLSFLRREAKINVGFKELSLEEVNNLEKYLEKLLKEAIAIDSSNSNFIAQNESYLEEYRVRLKNQLIKLVNNLQREARTSWEKENENSNERSLKGEELRKNREEQKKELHDIVSNEIVPTLVAIGHVIILSEEFPNVVETSIQEQMRWRQHKVSNEEQPTPKFVPIQGHFNSVLTELALLKLTQESLSSMSLKDMKDFFCSDRLDSGYRISSETLDDIPKPELKKIALRFVRIFQDIFATWRRKSSLLRFNPARRFVLIILAWVTNVVLRIFVQFL